MAKSRRAGSDLEVKIQTEESQEAVACRYGFLSMSRIFVRKIQFPLGTHVVVILMVAGQKPCEMLEGHQNSMSPIWSAG